jgi:hypothetical protein
MPYRITVCLEPSFQDHLGRLGLKGYEGFLNPSCGTMISEVRDRVVYFLPPQTADSHGFYLKVFRNPGANHPLRQWLQGGRPHSLAEVERRRLDWLFSQGICAPRVAAWGARMNGWREIDSFLLTAQLEERQAFDEWLVSASLDLPRRLFITLKRHHLTQTARLLAGLHAQGFDHPFPYLRHFFVDHTCTTEPAIIDVHSAVITRRPTSDRKRQRALAEWFLSSLKSPLSQMDRLRFFREYAGGQVDRRLLQGVLKRFGQKLRRHPNRYQWAQEALKGMPFPDLSGPSGG